MLGPRSTFFRRLAEAKLFTWGYLAYHVFSMVAMRFFLNSESIFEYSSFWISMILLEHAFLFSAFGILEKVVKRKSALLVISSTLLLGVLRTLITTSLAIFVGADPGVAWEYQLLLGALWELALACLWANLNGAFREHNSLVKRLNQTKESILGYRENAEEILAEENEKLLELTRTSLLPQIQLLEDAIAAGNTELAARLDVAHQLRGIIYNQVRPLSESLRSTAKALTNPPGPTPSHLLSVISIPKTFTIKNSIFPFTASAFMLLSYLASPFWLLDISWVIPSALLSITYFAVLSGFKRLLLNIRALPAWLAILTLALIAVIAVLPAYIVAVLFYPDTHQAAVYGSALVFVSLIVVGVLALLDSFDYEARMYRAQLVQQNEQLSIETALFEQQLWVARRNWSLVIHGTVQASLTAALTRLNAPDANKSTLNLAKKDLDRAIAALSTTPTSEVKFSSAIKEVVSTWQGVCDIELSVSAEVKKVISQDPRLGMCVNEIVKEAISNAVRHGDAKKARVTLGPATEGLIAIEVSNDGNAPRVVGRKGIGSRLLDELTMDWSLGFDSKSGQTILTARLPFLKPQA